jgi:phosphatidylserine/phosphatidylglycerophosphate/cardiolipin synthase-like enzyme
VVLANGSVKHAGEDENSASRHELAEAGVQVFDRMVAPGALGHNKFLVCCDASEQPQSVWTGSTNWTPTGLCTQINNGLLIQDEKAARIFLDQWNLLRESGRSFPPGLVAHNSTPKQPSPGDDSITVWFSRTNRQVDLDALNEEVKGAEEGILFLMFMPGAAGLYSTIAARSQEPALYVRGVVSELPREGGDESQVSVNLVRGAASSPMHLDIVQPEGIAHSFSYWAAEVSRRSFLRDIGFAIIHSKVVVIDPFGKAVVITGSHNLSVSASKKNDENFVIIRGNRKLAQAYAVNIMGVYRHYRWRAYLSEAQNPWEGLRTDATWQGPALQGESRKELNFWVSEAMPASALSRRDRAISLAQ